MGVFDFLFGSSLTIERLVKLDESELQEKLKKRNISELQKFCLKGCKNLNNEEKQKEIYVNAIMEFIREKKSELENSQLSENVKTAIEDSVTSKPVDLDKSPESMSPSLSEALEKPVDNKMPEGPGAPMGPPRPMGGPMGPPGPPVRPRPEDDEDDESDIFEPNEKMGEKPRGGKHGSKKRGGRTRRKREKKAKDAKEEKIGGKQRNSRKK